MTSKMVTMRKEKKNEFLYLTILEICFLHYFNNFKVKIAEL